MNFWLTFAIQEVMLLVTEFVDSPDIKPGLKSALDNLLQAAQTAIITIKAGV